MDNKIEEGKKTIEGKPVQYTMRKYDKLQKDEIVFLLVVIIPQIIMTCIFYIYANISSLTMAFRLPTGEWSMRTLTSAWKLLTTAGSDMSIAIRNTLLFFLKDNIMLFAQLMISYFFYKKIKGTRAFQIIFFLPSIVSGVAISTVFTSFINPEGPLGEICKSLGYKLPPLLASSTYKTWTIMFYTIWLGWAGNMLLLNGALARIPVEVIESARLDGVTAFREFVSIIFPLVWSTFSTLLILGFTGLLSAGGPILLFMDYGGVLDTWTVGFWMFYRIKIIGESAYNEVSAMGLYLTAIALPIIFFARKLVEKVPAVEY